MSREKSSERTSQSTACFASVSITEENSPPGLKRSNFVVEDESDDPSTILHEEQQQQLRQQREDDSSSSVCKRRRTSLDRHEHSSLSNDTHNTFLSSSSGSLERAESLGLVSRDFLTFRYRKCASTVAKSTKTKEVPPSPSSSTPLRTVVDHKQKVTSYPRSLLTRMSVPDPLKGNEDQDSSRITAKNRLHQHGHHHYYYYLSKPSVPANLLQLQQQEHERKSPATDTSESILLDLVSDDILASCIFSGCLNSFESVRLALVCKRFHRLAQSHIRKLDLRNCNGLTTSQVGHVATWFQNLTILDMSYCSQFGRKELQSLLPASASLKGLGLRGTQIRDYDFCAFLEEVSINLENRPSSLELIDLSAITKANSSNISDAVVPSILKHCPKARSLRFAWCSRITDDAVAMLTENLPNLTELDLSLTSITSKSCAPLFSSTTAGRNLRTLDISATKITHQGIVEALGHLYLVHPRQQQRMFISGTPCSQVGDSTETTSITGRRPMPPEELLLKLTRLTSRFLPALSLETLELLLVCAPKLQFLDVSHSGTSTTNPSLTVEDENRTTKITGDMKAKVQSLYRQAGVEVHGLRCWSV